MERINPLNDYVFKMLFGEDEGKERLVSFLNAVLGLEGEQAIVSVRIIRNTQLTKETLEDKTGRLDILAETADRTLINIEVQRTDQKNMDKRTLFYWGKLYLANIKKGEDYNVLRKVITINLLNFKFLPISKFHSCFHLREDEHKEYMLTDIMEIHFIELPKFRSLKRKQNKEIPLHRWLLYLQQNISRAQLEELMAMDPVIKKAEERLEWMANDEEMMARYNAKEDSEHEWTSMMNSAEERGEVKGKIDGKIEGKIEEKIEMVKGMLANKLDITTITKIAKMTIQEVEALQNQMKMDEKK